MTGFFGVSFLVCPVWFLVAIVRNAIERPGWRLALFRIGIPPLVLWIAVANDAIQRRIAEVNAERIIAACEEFRAQNGRLPRTLDELEPRYMIHVPPSRYCLSDVPFKYMCSDATGGRTILYWYPLPPYGRAIYDFEKRQWGYLD
jgi:hypothetical protein